MTPNTPLIYATFRSIAKNAKFCFNLFREIRNAKISKFKKKSKETKSSFNTYGENVFFFAKLRIFGFNHFCEKVGEIRTKIFAFFCKTFRSLQVLTYTLSHHPQQLINLLFSLFLVSLYGVMFLKCDNLFIYLQKWSTHKHLKKIRFE